MGELSPTVAVQLATRIYDVQNAAVVERFAQLPFFKKNTPNSKRNYKHLVADVGGRLLLNNKDGFGICIEGGDSYPDQIFLIFRGTTTANNNADALTDARIGITRSTAGLPVHIGFNHCFTSMLPDIRKFLLCCNPSVTTVHCIGHSLGGAVASLAADWIVRNSRFSARLYTFGAPRVGAGWFASSTTSAIGSANMHRVYHRTDPVSLVPLYPFMQAPYGEAGHYIYSAEPLTSGAAHKMAMYSKSVRGLSWAQLCQPPEEPYSVESAIESWLQSKTPVDSSSPTFWRWVDAAIIYVIKKVAMAAIYAIQGAFVGVFTVVDKIAYILATGITLAENISIWVVHLVRKLMEAIGMRATKKKSDLNRSLIRHVLLRVTEQANQDARDAIKKL